MLKVDRQGMMNRRDQGTLELFQQQKAVPQGLNIVKNVESLSAKDFFYDPQGAKAEDKHLREKAEAGS
jgi:hypothetical protein